MSIPTNMSSAPRDGSALLLTRYGKPSKFIGRWDGDKWVDAESGEFMSRVWHWEPANGHERKWWVCPLCRTPVLLHPADSPIGCHKDGCSNLSLPLIPRHEPAPVEGKCGTCGGILLGDTDKGIPGQCKCSTTQPAARPTPITDAVARAACDDTGCLCRPEILWDSHSDLERQLAEAKQEIADLSRWKSEMLFVDGGWDPQEIGELLGMTVGMDIRKNIKPRITKLIEQRDAMANLLKEIRAGNDGRIATPECDCDDCVFLTRIDKALASVEGDHQ